MHSLKQRIEDILNTMSTDFKTIQEAGVRILEPGWEKDPLRFLYKCMG